MSDIFGALVDRATGATGDDIWTIGEDVFTPGTANDGGLRNMKDPAEKGNYDWYPTRYIGTNDYGGVHSNSGIANLAFYLLVMGGPHPRGKSPDINVTGIGFEAAADIFYKANTMCLTPDSSFWFARHCTAETYGGEYQSSVRQAWDAVGVPNIVSLVLSVMIVLGTLFYFLSPFDHTIRFVGADASPYRYAFISSVSWCLGVQIFPKS
jgi:bacillolysin